MVMMLIIMFIQSVYYPHTPAVRAHTMHDPQPAQRLHPYADTNPPRPHACKTHRCELVLITASCTESARNLLPPCSQHPLYPSFWIPLLPDLMWPHCKKKGKAKSRPSLLPRRATNKQRCRVAHVSCFARIRVLSWGGSPSNEKKRLLRRAVNLMNCS